MVYTEYLACGTTNLSVNAILVTVQANTEQNMTALGAAVFLLLLMIR